MTQIDRFSSYTTAAAQKARIEDSHAGWMKLVSGTNVVRILPPLVGMDEPWITVHQHFIKLPGGQVTFNCPRRMENARCPGCEKADRLKATGHPKDELAAKELYPGQRNIAFALDRNAPDAGAQLLPFGATVKKRLRYFREKANKDFTNLATGYDIVIDKQGSGMGTEYQVDLGEQCPVMTDMRKFEALCETLPDLADFAKVLPYDTIVDKLRGAAGGVSSQPAIAGAPQVVDPPRGRSVQEDSGDDIDSDSPF